MSEQIQNLVTQWNGLKTEAESGQLRMDPEVCNALKGHADQMKIQLNRMLFAVGQLSELSGFGALRTAKIMQQKFENKADTGDASAAERLKQSIEVLTLMAETYEKAVRTIEETDQSNSQKLADVDTGGK
ncbi:hypothetical protein [Nocardia arizonensis]|uniref:hypothetical protein n=1 Tax=Nocardia arizonensis TaxID=1141647 RepID=UPI0006D13C32|nr:hypothetical protein [Nocardia arizonensis]